ncbi:MAG: hypothetical protein JHC87_09610 [Thermoleophilaceae bacterium]|nr:hypothetical protein [Thermoleophilaceae bacterium]
MFNVSRRGHHARFTLVLTLLTAVIFALAAASASATAINLRVETPDQTLYNGTLNTGPRSVSISENSSTCALGFPAATKAIAIANPITAAADFADAEGVGHIVKDYGWGLFLCNVGSYTGDDNNFWLVKINNRTKTAGGDYITGETELSAGDELLLYLTNSSETHSLGFNLPATAVAGEFVKSTIYKYSNNTDAKLAAKNATVAGGNATAVSDLNGQFKLKFDEPGTYLVSATAKNATRGSDVITITEPPPLDVVAAAQKQARHVCAKYRRGGRKYNTHYKRLYKRCFRATVERES